MAQGEYPATATNHYPFSPMGAERKKELLASLSAPWNTDNPRHPATLEKPRLCMKLRACLTTSLLLTLTGCQMLSYKEPTGGNTASIAFSSNNIAVQPVICVPGRGFVATAHAVSQKPFNSEFFDELNQSLGKKEVVTVKISTEAVARIGFVMQRKQANGPRKRCTVAAQLPVQTGHTYNAHFSTSGDHCGIAISASGNAVEDALVIPYKCP